MKNIEKYKNDLQYLIGKGGELSLSIQNECYPEKTRLRFQATIQDDKKVDELLKKLPPFRREYQSWYSESLVLIKQLLPDRLSDFVRLHEKPKSRKSVEYGNYVMEDYLQKLTVSSGFGEKQVGPEAAILQFEQQLNILRSIERRFESSLFDIKQLVQADLFDSELEAAKELNKNKFSRGAGAIAGVVLEKHLALVLDNHGIKPSKKTFAFQTIMII